MESSGSLLHCAEQINAKGDNSMQKMRLQKRKLALTAGMLVAVIFILDGAKRQIFRTDTSNSIVVDGSFRSNGVSNANAGETVPFTLDENGQPTTAFEGIKYAGFNETEIDSSDINQGLLVLADAEHPVAAANKDSMVDLADCKNEFYSLADEEEHVYLNADAAEALNCMMADYNSATELDDFVVYGTTDTFTGSGSSCDRYFQERVTGNTVDLALLGADSIIDYDGLDEEGWIIENCVKYGFIVRYPKDKDEKTGESYCPWHLRYVGKLHASNMQKNGLCLEEYLEALKTYSIDDPYECSYDDAGYMVYYIPSAGEKTPARVPLSGNYSISGNNSDGFIITTKK